MTAAPAFDEVERLQSRLNALEQELQGQPEDVLRQKTADWKGKKIRAAGRFFF